jgi:hypothetical protein
MIDIDRILVELDMYIPDAPQVSLQGIKGNNDPFYGIGRLSEVDHREDEFIVPNFNIEYTNSILKELGMYRSRLMNMSPKTCYSYHSDPTKRMHIPLITNENCFFVIDDQVSYYPANGNHYLVDTTKKHTFVNASFDYRLHIVGCVNS